MRVIFTQHITHYARAFHIRTIPRGIRFVHRKKNAPMHRFQAIAHIRQRTSDDHAHGVFEVRTAHFIFEAYRDSFFGELIHLGGFILKLRNAQAMNGP